MQKAAREQAIRNGRSLGASSARRRWNPPGEWRHWRNTGAHLLGGRHVHRRLRRREINF
jgi:hypothetical protein